ncbi:MAG: SRPBCC family protein [Planctomycetota bacterium]
MRKKTILISFGVLSVFLVMVFALPDKYSVSRTTFIASDGKVIQENLAGMKFWGQWTPWNQQEDLFGKFYSGSLSKVGSKVSWDSDKSGNGAIEIISAEPGRGIVYDLTLEGFSQSMGVIQITQLAGGCEVMWQLRGSVTDPLGVFFVPFMDYLVGPEFEKSLAGLKKRCE